MAETTTAGGDGPGILEGRLARLEGLVEGLKTSQTITFSAVALVGAMLLALGSWTVVRIDGLSARLDRTDGRIGDLNTKVEQLPAKINSDLIALVATLSQAITAAKQPTQVVLVPAPQPAPPAAEPAKPAPGTP